LFYIHHKSLHYYWNQ